MNYLQIRGLHRILAPLLFLPLLLTTVTGIVYRIGNSFFDMPKRAASIMMSIHQGSFLGSDIMPLYVFLNGVGTIGLLATGIVMSGVFRNRRISGTHRVQR